MAREKPTLEKPRIVKEFRFAVVMYGGVSLAIYINGVAQELYKMAKSTATKQDGSYFIENPKGTELIYRKIGQILQARFVVDVLSGTSAGGINAVYLAKALAKNQSMSELEDMWIREGDIQLLINDKESLNDTKGLKLIDYPKSLLNSQRIYYKLLGALESMDEAPDFDTSPYVDELDLYVTSTDIHGLLRPILLTDSETQEKRFRAVFHLYYSTLGTDKSDWLKPFDRDDNAFLAFIARATCALPAFQPANLDAIMDLDGAPYSQREDYLGLTHRWSRFLQEYSFEMDQFSMRFFGDGGVLDNKPFSYITEALLKRQSEVPIERRLFYIEPAPELYTDTKQQAFKEPDLIENLLAQGVGLPRYETIREDLLQIKFRNDLIERTNDILRQIERTGGDVRNLEKVKPSWRSTALDQMSMPAALYGSDARELYGPGYAAYQQLKIRVVLDSFALAVARNIGVPEESKEFLVLRQIFEGWRQSTYTPTSDTGSPSENELLYRLDVDWRLRRFQFLFRLIDEIYQSINDFRTDMKPEGETYARDIVKNSLQGKNMDEPEPVWSLDGPEAAERYRKALTQVKDDLNRAHSVLRIQGRKLRQRKLALRPIDSEDFEKDPKLRAYRQALEPLLAIKDRLAEITKMKDQLEKTWKAIEQLSLTLASRSDDKNSNSAGYLHQTFRDVAKYAHEALSIQASDDEALRPELHNVRDCLQFYYDNFEYYDKLIFPITYATPIGEAASVKVYRISPEDADSLFKETEDKRKLAGTKYFNFGAFFSREWRQNDILWGQLDGAERIITTLLANRELQEEYVARAWLTILMEKQHLLTAQNLKKLKERLGNAWHRLENDEELSSQEVRDLRLRLQEYFDCDYSMELKLSPEVILKVFTRALVVIAALMQGLVEKYPSLNSLSAWVSRVGKFVALLMEKILPGQPGRLYLERWLVAAYILEGFMIAVGVLPRLTGNPVLNFHNFLLAAGLVGLLLTGSIHFAINSIGKRIVDFVVSKL